MYLCCDAFPATRRMLPPNPLQHLRQRLAAEAMCLLLVRKLADGEVHLLLAGTWSAEGYTKDLHLCSTGARSLRLTAYLARSQSRCLGQANHLAEAF
jgi:hypothetical protein